MFFDPNLEDTDTSAQLCTEGQGLLYDREQRDVKLSERHTAQPLRSWARCVNLGLTLFCFFTYKMGTLLLTPYDDVVRIKNQIF